MNPSSLRAFEPESLRGAGLPGGQGLCWGQRFAVCSFLSFRTHENVNKGRPGRPQVGVGAGVLAQLRKVTHFTPEAPGAGPGAMVSLPAPPAPPLSS